MWPPFALCNRWHLSFMFLMEELMNFGGKRRAVRRRRAKYFSLVSFLLAGQRRSCALILELISDQTA